MLTQTALAHFRGPSAEQGRNILEAMLRTYPKRLDLWNVYIDQVGGSQSTAGWLLPQVLTDRLAGLCLSSLNYHPDAAELVLPMCSARLAYTEYKASFQL